MVTQAHIALSGDGTTATLIQLNRTLRIQALSPANARFQLVSTKPSTTAENQNLGTTKLVLQVPAPAQPGPERIAVLLSPMGAAWPILPPPDINPLSDWR
jgi:hypothetical protein